MQLTTYPEYGGCGVVRGIRTPNADTLRRGDISISAATLLPISGIKLSFAGYINVLFFLL
jgi:hypothetical protein